MNAALLHERAVCLAKTYKQSESGLLSILISMQKADAFRRLDYPNLFVYCRQALGLSESQSSYFLRVAVKSEEVPALKEAIDRGTLSLSQARRVVNVITPANSKEWIEKAATLPQRKLERAVTVANPKAVVREKIRPIAPTRSELRVGISVELEAKLQRVREVLASNKKQAVSLEAALEEMAALFLKHKDPLEKALRVKSPSSGRAPVSASRHEVNRRDQGVCQARLPNGERCHSKFWVEQHHIVPKAHGGPDVPSNLITLCSQHHKMQHLPGLHHRRNHPMPLPR